VRNPEILAPAGSADALKAAVRCGAAAVYLGTDAFNARQHAENFAGDALKEAVAYCHIHGVQVHLTLNTLIRENEFEEAKAVAVRAQEYGVDALILQDVGLARVLHTLLPDMPLHASTQLSCHTPDGVRFLRDQGFSRVVLSREMSLEEIKTCANLGCELEVFVHGALCMCVSGQCYLSAAIGGRSGNRGVCAQPCRLPFSAKDTDNRTDGFALSLKDLSLTQYIPALFEAGVTSFKIEGRMKRPEYVAAAVTVCRAAAEGKTVSDELQQQLQAVFSRSGFTDGYYTGKRGTAMFGTRRQEDVVAAPPALKALAKLYEKELQTVPVTMHLTAAVGVPTTLTVSDTDGHTVTVEGATAEIAITTPTTAEKAIASLCKTGGTPYLATATADIGDNAMLPASLLNGLRREALVALDAARAVFPERRIENAPPTTVKNIDFTPKRVLRLQNAAQYSDRLCEETVVLPLSTPKDILAHIAEQHKGLCGIEIPRGVFSGTASIRQKLHSAKQTGIRFVLCNNVNGIEAAKEAGLPILGGFGCNVTNAEAAAFYAGNGFAGLTLSPELSFPQMQFAKKSIIPCGVLIYGRLPLMLTRNCPRSAAGGSCNTCKGEYLVDRRHTSFPLVCENGCTELLNSVPTYWGDRPNEVPDWVFPLYHFTIETAQEVATILELHDTEKAPPFPITRGMYRKGVE